jgi:hypothetical protein
MKIFKEQNPANAMVYVNQTITALAQCRTSLTLLDGQPEDVILGGADISDLIGDIVDVCYLFTDQSYTDGNDTLLARPGHHCWRPSHCWGSLISKSIRRDWRLDVLSNFFLVSVKVTESLFTGSSLVFNVIGDIVALVPAILSAITGLLGGLGGL